MDLYTEKCGFHSVHSGKFIQRIKEREEAMKKKMITIAICAFVAVSTNGNGYAGCKRFKKDMSSQFSNCLEREIIVRNFSGEIIM